MYFLTSRQDAGSLPVIFRNFNGFHVCDIHIHERTTVRHAPAEAVGAVCFGFCSTPHAFIISG
ncbi:hypothetical protein EAO08_32310 [Klebsiella pneumoniae]|nr:hypothetical protein EAO08_32310 [Klebsiella pneumoniae]